MKLFKNIHVKPLINKKNIYFLAQKRKAIDNYFMCGIIKFCRKKIIRPLIIIGKINRKRAFQNRICFGKHSNVNRLWKKLVEDQILYPIHPNQISRLLRLTTNSATNFFVTVNTLEQNQLPNLNIAGHFGKQNTAQIVRFVLWVDNSGWLASGSCFVQFFVVQIGSQGEQFIVQFLLEQFQFELSNFAFQSLGFVVGLKSDWHRHFNLGGFSRFKI
ncbi:hypothetical protein BpHYR1_024376 [Brachionus plicatilis]|uniref:Uncharacterized protein n=1 Tax=Brachionus plicatilis TaxID=10195 RepID=A0A3M7R1L7_BRAPC|nr:hypothetical protein BpHYR1_024376 [Brachionus plicatilis]